MNINITKKDSLSIISLNETRLDASIAPQFKQEMEKIIADGNTQIILDISKLSFMDSSSLGAMVAVLKAMGNQGKMVVSGASGVVLDLFKLTRMDNVFTLVETTEDAQQYFTETA
ncbi:MAG: STAS domain-containing protein [Cocleimonas sp.]|nr:STAS domain-containing protein [Cocleimonas sp.]